jgi:hypothetical protein
MLVEKFEKNQVEKLKAQKKSEIKEMNCSIKCNHKYFECIDKGEHESVCNMQRAQCNCSCK